MLKNKLVELVLCERYNASVSEDKKCNCYKNLKEQDESTNAEEPKNPQSNDEFVNKAIALLTMGAVGASQLARLKNDIMRFLEPPQPTKTDPDVVLSALPSLIQEPQLRSPRKQKVKEFGQSIGQVIAS